MNMKVIETATYLQITELGDTLMPALTELDS